MVVVVHASRVVTTESHARRRERARTCI